MGYAPIVIFIYRRDISKLIDSLHENYLYEFSDLIIFSDGSRNERDLDEVLYARKIANQVDGFKSVSVLHSLTNMGLSASIINGVSSVLKKYKKIIVLEDDLIVSPFFLEYMNTSLNYYYSNKHISSISGYGPNIGIPHNYKKDVYLSHRSCSWGWGTWHDRWSIVDWEVNDFNYIKNNQVYKDKFNNCGNDLYKMLELQMIGKIDSWSIRFTFSQFFNNKYTVYPLHSLVINDGFFDGKGTHTSGMMQIHKYVFLNSKINIENISYDEYVALSFKKHYDLNLKSKIGYFLKKHYAYTIFKKIDLSIMKYLRLITKRK